MQKLFYSLIMLIVVLIFTILGLVIYISYQRKNTVVYSEELVKPTKIKYMGKYYYKYKF